MRFSSVIFDFNGTLYWDTHLHNAAWDTFLANHDISLTDKEKGRFIHGRNNQDIFRSIMGDQITISEIERYIDEKEAIYRNLCLSENLRLAPGAESLLDFLTDNGIKFTIATASGKENVDFYFEYLQLGKWFDYSKVVFNDGRIKSKPDPEIFLQAMKILSSNPSETLIFEDTITGVKAALAANPGKVCLVYSDPANFFDSGLDVVRSFDEVDRMLFQ
jgi:HAD superfamily hydrolase (TIGR01509 family)